MFKTGDTQKLKSKLNYYVKRGDLINVRRGLYVKDEHYNRYELATKILTPSYISFETVLSSTGVIFQYYNQLFVASYQTRTILCDKQTYSFRALKPTILTNSLGIEIHENYSIACPERAFLDIVYRRQNYHFDNLEPLDWEKVYKILTVYGDNKSMKYRVDRYFNSFQEERS